MQSVRPALNVLLDELEDAGKLTDDDALLQAFTDWAEETGRPLYVHQEEAALAIFAGHHTIAATPTGSGKTLIALAAHLYALAHDQRSYYTAPLKALVSEKFFELISLFGAQNVGMITGDGAVNADAPIICCTTEIVAQQALGAGEGLDVGTVVMDEFHFYADRQRGWAWQVPLLTLPQAQFVLLSATLGDTSFFAEDLKRRSGRDVETITSATRPVPLDFHYSTTPLHEVLAKLTKTGKAPIYVVHFSQREAVERAQALLSVELIDAKRAKQIHAELAGVHFAKGFGQQLAKLLRKGIGVHHAGMLPRYRRIVERLTQQGLLVVVCGTDTLGVGINVPIRTVVFTQLAKFDGRRERLLSAREFHQIAGRAGRAGFDEQGDVVVLAPAHVIEHEQARIKAGDDPAKLRKLAKKKPQKVGVNWSKSTFDRLVDAQPEALTSQFHLTHAMVLAIMSRPGDPVAHLYDLLTNTHEPYSPRNLLLREAVHIIRSLRQAGVVEHISSAEAAGGPRLRLIADLPEEFALNQPLSPFALAALELLDPDADTFALDVVSIIEAITPGAMPVLYAQERELRGEAIAKMKADGLDYDERMAQLEQISWPKPLAELLEQALATYVRTNPWVIGYELEPKSVVRQMIEQAMTFTSLISRYQLARAEGVVLRYLTDVYRSLRQIVGEQYEQVNVVVDWLGDLIRAVDSSLLDEWEALTNSKPAETESEAAGGEETAFGVGADGQVSYQTNPHLLRNDIRKDLMQLIQLLDREDYEAVTQLFQVGHPYEDAGLQTWSAEAWADALDPYFEEFQEINTGVAARAAHYLHWESNPDTAALATAGFEVTEELKNSLLVEQILLDDVDDRGWSVRVVVDVAASEKAGHPVFVAGRVGEVGASWA